MQVPEVREKADLTKYRNAGREVIQVDSTDDEDEEADDGAPALRSCHGQDQRQRPWRRGRTLRPVIMAKEVQRER